MYYEEETSKPYGYVIDEKLILRRHWTRLLINRSSQFTNRRMSDDDVATLRKRNEKVLGKMKDELEGFSNKRVCRRVGEMLLIRD